MSSGPTRILHLTCRACGYHLTQRPNLGGGQFVTCKCGARQPGLPALWWAWDRLEQMAAIRKRNRDTYNRRHQLGRYRPGFPGADVVDD